MKYSATKPVCLFSSQHAPTWHKSPFMRVGNQLIHISPPLRPYQDKVMLLFGRVSIVPDLVGPSYWEVYKSSDTKQFDSYKILTLYDWVFYLLFLFSYPTRCSLYMGPPINGYEVKMKFPFELLKDPLTEYLDSTNISPDGSYKGRWNTFFETSDNSLLQTFYFLIDMGAVLKGKNMFIFNVPTTMLFLSCQEHNWIQ